MSATDPVLSASRIANATRVAQAADDTGVTGWVLTAPFIIAAQLDEQRGPWTAVYKIQWRAVGGTFADLAATGALKYTTATDLVNGNAVTSGEAICTNDPGGVWKDGEEVEGTGTADSIVLADEEYTEIHVAIDPADAAYATEYEFQIYDVTNGGAIGTCVATVTTEAAPPAEINQYFRIRKDDTQAINENGGTNWYGAMGVDASMDMGSRFRIRFEIEETLGTTFNSAIKLQYNKNAGGWVDAVAYPDSSPATTPVIWCRESDTYTDPTATTNILTSSAETFTAGNANNDPAAAAVSLTNAHTEHEFVIEIPTWYDGALRNIATDYFDFRLVESDGTVFGGTYDNPRITMTQRAGHIGATGIESPGHVGPLCDGNGNLYWACEPSESDPKVMMLKSTTGGDTWFEMDGAGRPTTTDFESGAMVYVGNVIHLMIENGGEASYHQFNTSSNGTTPDTWVITDEVIATGYTNTDQSGSLEVRSDGTVVAFYRRTVTNEGIYYKIRSTVPAWGTEVELDTTASTEFVAIMTVLGASDKIHCFYKDDTNFTVLHKSLNSSDTLSAVETVMADASQEGAGINWAMTNAVYWDSSGTEKVMIVVQDESDVYLYSITIADDGTPGTRKLVDAVTVNNNPVPFNGRQPTAMLAVNPATDTVYCFYVDLTTFDVWWLSNVDDGTWDATATEIHDGVEGEVIRGNVFTHNAGNGGATVVGYVWENGSNGLTGYQEYNEYALSTATLYYQSNSGATTSSGSLLTKVKKFLTGTLTSSGTLIKKAKKSVAGATTSAGVLIKKSYKSLAGAITSSGVVTISTKYIRSIAGAMTSTGVLSTLATFKRTLAGAMDSTGNIYKKVIIALSGAMSSDGTLSKKMKELLSGALTSVGTLALKSRFTKALSGAMTSAGVITKKTILFLSGATISAGVIIKNTKKLLVGVLTSSGVVDGVKQAGIYYQSISGAMTSSSVLLLKTKRLLTGDMSSVGTLAKKMYKILSGILTSSGVLNALKIGNIYYQSISGAMTSSGTVTTLVKFLRTLTGAMSSGGVLSTSASLFRTLTGAMSSGGVLLTSASFFRTLTGAMSSSGSVTTLASFFRTLTGAMTSGGSISRKIYKYLAGILSSSGYLNAVKVGITVYYQSVAGSLTSSGNILRVIKTSLSGVMTSAGTIRKKMFKTLSGAMTSIGAIIGTWMPGAVLSRTVVIIEDTNTYIINIEDEGHT